VWIPGSVRVASVVPECAWSARRRFWIMSHQVQLSPAAAHRPTAALDPARHAAEPPACRSRCPYSRPDMRRILSHLGNPICTRIFHTSAKDSQTSPRTGRQDQSARSATIPPSVGWQARFPAKREATRGHRRAPGAALHTGPSGQRSASKTHDRDRPAGYPGATCHRPPRDPRRHQMQASPMDEVFGTHRGARFGGVI
jgi:hypothetical protein